MNKVSVLALNENGRAAMLSYVAKYKNKKRSWRAKAVNRAMGYSETVDSIESPGLITVTLGKVLEAQDYLIIPKIHRSVLNILRQHGGKEEDFEVRIE